MGTYVLERVTTRPSAHLWNVPFESTNVMRYRNFVFSVSTYARSELPLKIEVFQLLHIFFSSTRGI